MYAVSLLNSWMLFIDSEVQLSSDFTIRPGNNWKECPRLELVDRGCIPPIAFFRP
jgi:hypothetical protein